MTTPERARVFFEQARSACKADRVEHYRIAEATVRVASAGGFDFVHRAFAHLRAEAEAEADLEIFVWEKSAMPSPPWSTGDYGVRGEIRGYNDARFQTAFDHIGNSLSMLDRAQQQAIFWTRDAAALPQSERSAPLKAILHWWIEGRGGLFLHGAAVGNETSAILLAGAGGAGKSTTALLGAASGMNYLGDDYCAAEISARPALFSLYGTGKISRDNPAKIGLTSDATEEKQLFYLHEAPGFTMKETLPLSAIIVPQIDPTITETTLVASTAAEALKALAPSTISQLSGAGTTTFQRLAQLVQAVPCYRLLLARDFENIGAKIREFLDEQIA